jgi:hypothetical protein
VGVPSTAGAATHFDAVLSVCVCLCLSASDCVCGLVVWLVSSSRVDRCGTCSRVPGGFPVPLALTTFALPYEGGA